MHGFLDCLGGFARDFGDLPHQVGAEWKNHVRQTCDVGKEGVSVFLLGNPRRGSFRRSRMTAKANLVERSEKTWLRLRCLGIKT
jgi:hypothetical protein